VRETCPPRRLLQALRALHAVLRRSFDWSGELLHGIKTSEVVRLEQLGLAGSNRVDYEPSSWLALRRVLRKRDVTAQDVFIDFGSGKGRVVYQAALYPFKRVIGVELSQELTEIAQRNIDHARAKLKCRNIELVYSDVLEYDIPDDVTVAYFYNPFEGDVFAAVIDKLVASLKRRPRVLRVIYANPREEAVLMRAGARLLKVSSGYLPRAWAKASSVRMYAFPGIDAAAIPAAAERPSAE
jgi:hypothetical protein